MMQQDTKTVRLAERDYVADNYKHNKDSNQTTPDVSRT